MDVCCIVLKARPLMKNVYENLKKTIFIVRKSVSESRRKPAEICLA
jgi:uncharacterized membrane protein